MKIRSFGWPGAAAIAVVFSFSAWAQDAGVTTPPRSAPGLGSSLRPHTRPAHWQPPPQTAFWSNAPQRSEPTGRGADPGAQLRCRTRGTKSDACLGVGLNLTLEEQAERAVLATREGIDDLLARYRLQDAIRVRLEIGDRRFLSNPNTSGAILSAVNAVGAWISHARTFPTADERYAFASRLTKVTIQECALPSLFSREVKWDLYRPDLISVCVAQSAMTGAILPVTIDMVEAWQEALDIKALYAAAVFSDEILGAEGVRRAAQE